MHREQQRPQPKNIISKLVVIALSIVLLTGISIVPVIQVRIYTQQSQQTPQQQNKVDLSQAIKQIGQQVADANPGTHPTHV
jgi:CHASE3 domain sensor protein